MSPYLVGLGNAMSAIGNETPVNVRTDRPIYNAYESDPKKAGKFAASIVGPFVAPGAMLRGADELYDIATEGVHVKPTGEEVRLPQAIANVLLPQTDSLVAPGKVGEAFRGRTRFEKAQVQAMLKVLLPGAKIAGADAADALAVAIASAHLSYTPVSR